MFLHSFSLLIFSYILIILIEYIVKPRSYGLSFHEFRPRFALFPVVGTGRIGVARGLVSASVVSRFMAVNSSHSKGRRGVSRRRQCIRSLERCREICQASRRGYGGLVGIPPTTVHKYEPRATRDLPSHTPWEQGLSGLEVRIFATIQNVTRPRIKTSSVD
ncbi:hypothetical protein AVEN_186094-1 [Araneus ventricosus]|uniref:Uncharacterized protein n=1 Tax=Araneus ventricosus TaxID=182803 RepID=A0A4Y2K8G2_ARAVE|nr:hypothetical protein AVEN_186094-1 [Araneus ventricosus]